MRSTPSAPAASGLAGATSGSPERRTVSISIGHSVSGQAVRKRHVSPCTGSVSTASPAGSRAGSVRSGCSWNWTIAADGIGAR